MHFALILPESCDEGCLFAVVGMRVLLSIREWRVRFLLDRKIRAHCTTGDEYRFKANAAIKEMRRDRMVGVIEAKSVLGTAQQRSCADPWTFATPLLKWPFGDTRVL